MAFCVTGLSVLCNWFKHAANENGSSSLLTASVKEELAILRRENKQLRLELEILEKATTFFAKDHILNATSLSARRLIIRLSNCVNFFKVSKSGSHVWKSRPKSLRKRENRELTVQIKSAFRGSRKSYGSPRLTDEFKSLGVAIGQQS